jgi:hypothetical protein
MNGLDAANFVYRSSTGLRLKARKAELKKLAEEGQNWALEELDQLRRAEHRKNREAYQRFKARRSTEALRTKWRIAKAALRATKAEAEAEAKRLQREAEELAVKTARTAAANAEREAGIVGPERNLERPSQPAEEPAAAHVEEEPLEREAVKVKVSRICANPRLVLCAYIDSGLERRVLVRVGRNANFVPGMELKAMRPARETEPWVFQGKLPRLRGRW